VSAAAVGDAEVRVEWYVTEDMRTVIGEVSIDGAHEFTVEHFVENGICVDYIDEFLRTVGRASIERYLERGGLGPAVQDWRVVRDGNYAD
jgi:hypothetical protein